LARYIPAFAKAKGPRSRAKTLNRVKALTGNAWRSGRAYAKPTNVARGPKTMSGGDGARTRPNPSTGRIPSAGGTTVDTGTDAHPTEDLPEPQRVDGLERTDFERIGRRQTPPTPRPPDPRRGLAIVLAAVVAAAALGWIAGRQIQSPAEIAARTAPPAASIITVPVEQRILTADVVVRGSVRHGSPRTVTLPKSPLKVGTAIITNAPITAATLNEGDSALSVSGRPVFMLQGAMPAYRDLGPGATGQDVKQLEEFLARRGLGTGPADGNYDGRTATAVAAWYRASGWTPLGPTDEQLLVLRTIETDWFAAQLEDLAAEETLSTARGTHSTASADVTHKTNALEAAIDAERVAKIELDEARSASPPASQSQIARLEAAVRQATAAIGAARVDLQAANAMATQAGSAVKVGERRMGVTSKRDRALAGQVGQASAKLGIQVPADEILFFPSFPVRVDEVTAKTGEEPSGPIMTISSSELAIDAALSPNDAKLVRQGASVTIEEPEQGIRVSGTVTQIADAPGTNGVDPQRFFLQVTPKDAPASLVGASVVLNITVNTTEKEVLAVPVAALSVSADGTTRVQVQNRQGERRYVTVTPGLAAKGLVAITPVKGTIKKGDLVVVGVGPNGARRNPLSTPSAPESPTR
jgi:peptidoglycan hydrolase-like protein with peptidoglycan-binding domain